MALNSNALVELNETKTFVGVPLSESSHDSLIESFINSCSTLIEKYCDYRFREIEYTHYFDGGGVSEILLKQYPVNSITSIHEDGARDFGSDSLLDSSNYQLFTDQNDDDFIVQRFDGVFAKGAKNVKIVYKAGYPDFDDVPEDLKLACKITVAYYYQKQQERDWSHSSRQKGDENINLIEGIPESATEILANYERLEMIAPVRTVRNQ